MSNKHDDDSDQLDQYDNDEDFDENREDDEDGGNKSGGGKSRIILFIVIFLIAIGGGIYFGLNSNSDIFEKLQAFSLKSNEDSKEIASSSAEQKEASQSSSSQLSSAISSAGENKTDENASDKTVKNNEGVQLMTFESDSISKFVQCGNGFYYFTKDGVKFYQSTDNQKWNDTYTLSNITTVSNGDYAAVYEMLGRNLRVYSPDGKAYTVQANGLITHCELNPSGYSTIILNCDDEYKVQVYSSDGTLLLERFDEDQGVFPISSALSDDGKVLAVTYADTSDVSLISRVMLFYTSKDDSRQTDTGDFFAAIEKEDTVIPFIKYDSKGYFTALSDKSIFAVDTKGKEIWNVDLTNKAEKAAILNNGDIVLALGDELAGKDGYPYGTLLIVGSGGKTEGEFKTGQSITYLNTTEKGIIVGNNKNFTCLNDKGKVLWTFDATQDISCIIPFDMSGRKILIVTSTNAEIINAKK
jgi:flagellar basal body-associated protein FliL